MSESKKLSFDDLVDAELSSADWVTENISLKRGTMSVSNCSSESLLAWFEENAARKDDGTPDTDRRRFRGLRLMIRSLLDADGSFAVKDAKAFSDDVMGKLERFKKMPSSENAKLVAAAMRVNGIDLENDLKNLLGVAKTPGASPIASPNSSDGRTSD